MHRGGWRDLVQNINIRLFSYGTMDNLKYIYIFQKSHKYILLVKSQILEKK